MAAQSRLFRSALVRVTVTGRFCEALSGRVWVASLRIDGTAIASFLVFSLLAFALSCENLFAFGALVALGPEWEQGRQMLTSKIQARAMFFVCEYPSGCVYSVRTGSDAIWLGRVGGEEGRRLYRVLGFAVSSFLHVMTALLSLPNKWSFRLAVMSSFMAVL